LPGEHVEVDRLEGDPFQVGEVHVELVSGRAELALPGLEADAGLEEGRLADAGGEPQGDHVNEERRMPAGLDRIEARHVGAGGVCSARSEGAKRTAARSAAVPDVMAAPEE